MDDQELDRRIRRMLEVAQTDAPGARRWHPPTPRPNRTAGVLAAAAAVMVFGLMGFALIRGLAGSSSDDASSSATSAGGASQTTSAGSSAAETTTASATETTSPSETTSPASCTSGTPAPGSFGTISPDTQPIELDLTVTPSITCPGATVHVTFLVDNTDGTSQFVFPEAEVLLVSGGGLRWQLGVLRGESLAPGTSITQEGDFVVPQVPEGIYQVFVRGLQASATLQVRARLP